MKALQITSHIAVRPSSGFTLIELLITLVIAVSITAISGTVYSLLSSGTTLKATSQDILVTLRQARMTAITKRKEVSFALDNKKRIYWIIGDNRQRALDASLDLQMYSAQDLKVNKNILQIHFAPDGSSSGGEIKITNGKKVYRIVVEWLSGKVELSHG